MLRLQMLPAACGDCIWLEYGPPAAPHIVIIDGGLRGAALRKRLESAHWERGEDTLEVELLVVTHIDNDHIVGIIELLRNAPPWLRLKDIWFNGRPQLMRLSTPAPEAPRKTARKGKRKTELPADFLGDGEPDEEENQDESVRSSPLDLLGTQQGDELSELLATCDLPWNRRWKGEAVLLPETGDLPVVELEGGLTLTLLGPTLDRLYRLCIKWPDLLGGDEDSSAVAASDPDDLLGRSDTWPPEWKDGEGRDPSITNGSSIMLLAEYNNHALLFAGDGHAADLVDGLERICRERGGPPSGLPLAAFKLPHHGSERNLTGALLEKIDCSRYLISTDSSSHFHPDHQALLRILRYSKRAPQLLFNYASDITLKWSENKSDVIDADFPDYTTEYPTNPSDGLIVDLN